MKNGQVQTTPLNTNGLNLKITAWKKKNITLFVDDV